MTPGSRPDRLQCFVDRNIRECKMKVVHQPSGCHWVACAARCGAFRGRVSAPVPFAGSAVSVPARRVQELLPLTPETGKPIIPKL